MLPEKDDREFFSFDALAHAFRLVHFGLKRIEDENQRYHHLRDGIQSTTGVRLPVKLLAMEERRPDGSKSDSLISEEQWASLKSLVLARIEAAASDGRLRRLEGLSYLLWRWKEWAGEDAVKNWLAAELKTDSDALWVLRVFLSTMRTDGGEGHFHALHSVGLPETVRGH